MRSLFRWPLAIAVAVAVLACIPALFNPHFFQRGDTAAQFGPTWFHFGELVRSGQWPLMDTSTWAGGNYVAEALFGVYSPLNAVVWVFVSLMPDLLVAVFMVKVAFLVLLAWGTYAVAREYGAEEWAAAAVAVALPFSGYTLFWDAGSWASGLMAFAYMPWVWWSFRRVLRGTMNPLWAFLIGSLAILQGNPYGTLAVVLVGVALVVEALVTGERAGLVRLVLVGLCVAAWLPLVYLPLLETAVLAERGNARLFFNSGKLRPEIGDLLGLSSPTFVPGIKAITGPMQVPATYFAWFVVPLLPWLRFGALRGRLRGLTGAGVLLAGYVLLSVGPSKLWLFRWPVRLVEYAWLALAVLLAVLLSRGLHRDHVRARVAATAALVLVAGWLNWSQDPLWLRAALIGPFLLAVLATVLVVVVVKIGPGRVLSGVLVGGVALVLVAQAVVFGENKSSRVWHFPHDVSELQQRFASYDGRVMQFARFYELQAGPDRELVAAWDHFLGGSMYQVAGVDAVNAYTGMGFVAFEDRLCLHYDGGTRACGFPNVWKPVAAGGAPLADLMKLETIVVQPGHVPQPTPGEGWSPTGSSLDAIVLTRDEPLPWPDSELAVATQNAEVTSARTIGNGHERVEVATGARPSKLTFALLAWPGYEATFDGEPIEVHTNAAGLVRIDLPANSSGELELTWSPPGQATGIGGALLGLLGAVALALWTRRTGRTEPGRQR